MIIIKIIYEDDDKKKKMNIILMKKIIMRMIRNFSTCDGLNCFLASCHERLSPEYTWNVFATTSARYGHTIHSDNPNTLNILPDYFYKVIFIFYAFTVFDGVIAPPQNTID